MAVRLSEVERAYFVHKLGENSPNTRPLNDIKRAYFGKVVPTINAQTPLNEAESLWMESINSNPDQAPIGKGSRGKILFYINGLLSSASVSLSPSASLSPSSSTSASESKSLSSSASLSPSASASASASPSI